MVDAFVFMLRNKALGAWRLVLAGGAAPPAEAYFAELKAKSRNFPITLMPNIAYDELVDLYSRASLYWHAGGFGSEKPAGMEHFGISVVEAMSAGCIPFVYNGGGLPEIVQEGVDGYLWNTIEDLVKKTSNFVAHEEKSSGTAERAKKRAKQFDSSIFVNAFDRLLVKISK